MIYLWRLGCWWSPWVAVTVYKLGVNVKVD